MTFKKHTYKFSCILNPYKQVIFKPVKDSDFTSTMCGCLNDSVAHDGILFTGNDVTINRKSSTLLTNYLITAPSPGAYNVTPEFSFNATLYILNNKNYTPDFSVARLIYQKKAIFDEIVFKNIPYLSIISPQPLTAQMFGMNKTISYMPSNNQRCDVKINNDNYRHRIKNIAIFQSFNSLNDSLQNTLPDVELLGDSVAIIWQGKPHILDQYGLRAYLKKLPDSLNYTDVLIIKSPFATRINPIAWDDILEDNWRYSFRKQFGKFDKAIVFGDIPWVIYNKGNVSFLQFNKITPAETPNWVKRDTAEYQITIDKILGNQEYDSLFKKFSINEGFIYSFNKGAYSIGDVLNVKFPPHYDSIISKLYNKQLKNNLSANEKLELSRAMMQNLKYAHKDTSYNKKVELDNQEIYFRYPPISSENNISIFSHFDSLKLVGSKGEIIVDNKSHLVDENNMIEFSDLQDCKFTYPTIEMGTQNTGMFMLKGTGNVKIDGNNLGESFFETETFQILTLIMGLLSFIVAMSQFTTFTSKIHELSQFIKQRFNGI